MKIEAVAAALLLLAVSCAPASDAPADEGPEAEAALPVDVQARVTARLDALDAISTLYAKHLPSGREIAVRADRPMNTLSVIKIPVMVQAFLDARSGRLDLDRRYVVEADDMWRGSGLIQTFEPGLNPTLRGLVTQMIITSDNTATDMVIEAVGLELEQILEAEITDREASDEMVAILSRQLYASRLPQRVRWQGVGVAHKTGDWPPIAGNDVGILFYEGGPAIVSVFTNQNTGAFFELEATLGLIAEDIVEAWR